MTEEQKSQQVFNEYKPLRNYMRQVDLMSSLYAIHQHILHQQYRNPLASDISAPPGYNKIEPPLYYFTNFYVSPWEIESLIKELIINGIEYGAKKTFMQWPHLVPAANKLKRLEDEISGIYISEENVLLELTRIAHRQFHWQQPPTMDKLARYWKFYKHPSLEAILKSELDVTSDELYIISLLITGAFLRRFRLSFPIDAENSIIDPSKVNNIAGYYISTLSEIRKKLETNQEMNDKYAYAYHALIETPLILVDNNSGKTKELICPVLPRLFNGLTEGIFYRICNSENFSRAYGLAFEEYVGGFANKIGLREKMITEQTYSNGKRSTDWIYVDDESILFAECKTKRITIDVKQDLDTIALEKQLEYIADAFLQVYQNVSSYKNNEYDFLPYKAEKAIFPFVVTLENWYLFGPVFHKILKEKLKLKLERYDLDDSIIDKHPYVLCSIDSFEYLMQLFRYRSAKNILSDKMKGEEFEWDLATYLHNRFADNYGPFESPFREEFNDMMEQRKLPLD